MGNQLVKNVKVDKADREDGSQVVHDRKHSSTVKAQQAPKIAKVAIKSPSLDYTHFVSLPLTHPELVKKLNNFQNSLLGNSDTKKNDTDTGIEKSMVTNPKTFHLTVLMLKLGNKERVDVASKVLKGLSSKIEEAVDHKQVRVRLKGMETFQDSMAKARVLYAPVVRDGNEGRLSRACHVIIDAFIKAGLAEKDAKQKLTLHATLMNVKHRRNKKNEKIDSFDAREISKQYGSMEWGAYLIREAHLSQRSVYDENGYFHCCASLHFP